MAKIHIENYYDVLKDEDENEDENEDEDEDEDLLDIPPYKDLLDIPWKSIQHPISALIRARFSPCYNGKLLWRELDAMKKRIDKRKRNLEKYTERTRERRRELDKKIQDTTDLCKTYNCSQELQKHLDKCTGIGGSGRYKCTENLVSYDCENGENGRCSHYYEIESAKYDLAYIECYEFDENMEIEDLESKFQIALAIKEDRLEEYLYDYTYYDD